MQKVAMPLQPHRACLFYLISSEAYLLTLLALTNILVLWAIKKEAVACQGARPGVWPVKWQRSS
jgi:hypothetical protein